MQLRAHLIESFVLKPEPSISLCLEGSEDIARKLIERLHIKIDEKRENTVCALIHKQDILLALLKKSYTSNDIRLKAILKTILSDFKEDEKSHLYEITFFDKEKKKGVSHGSNK